jgi:hypothetical protein
MKLFIAVILIAAAGNAIAWDLVSSSSTDQNYPPFCPTTVSIQRPDAKTLKIIDTTGKAVAEFNNLNGSTDCRRVDFSKDISLVTCDQSTFNDGVDYVHGRCFTTAASVLPFCNPFSTEYATITNLTIGVQLSLDVVDNGYYDGMKPHSHCIYNRGR